MQYYVLEVRLCSDQPSWKLDDSELDYSRRQSYLEADTAAPIAVSDHSISPPTEFTDCMGDGHGALVTQGFLDVLSTIADPTFFVSLPTTLNFACDVTLFFFQPTNIIDALDRNACKSGGLYTRTVFKDEPELAELTGSAPLFRPKRFDHKILIRDDLAEALAAADLNGFRLFDATTWTSTIKASHPYIAADMDPGRRDPETYSVNGQL